MNVIENYKHIVCEQINVMGDFKTKCLIEGRKRYIIY